MANIVGGIPNRNNHFSFRFAAKSSEEALDWVKEEFIIDETREKLLPVTWEEFKLLDNFFASPIRNPTTNRTITFASILKNINTEIQYISYKRVETSTGDAKDWNSVIKKRVCPSPKVSVYGKNALSILGYDYYKKVAAHLGIPYPEEFLSIAAFNNLMSRHPSVTTIHIEIENGFPLSEACKNLPYLEDWKPSPCGGYEQNFQVGNTHFRVVIESSGFMDFELCLDLSSYVVNPYGVEVFKAIGPLAPGGKYKGYDAAGLFFKALFAAEVFLQKDGKTISPVFVHRPHQEKVAWQSIVEMMMDPDARQAYDIPVVDIKGNYAVTLESYLPGLRTRCPNKAFPYLLQVGIVLSEHFSPEKLEILGNYITGKYLRHEIGNSPFLLHFWDCIHDSNVNVAHTFAFIETVVFISFLMGSESVKLVGNRLFYQCDEGVYLSFSSKGPSVSALRALGSYSGLEPIFQSIFCLFFKDLEDNELAPVDVHFVEEMKSCALSLLAREQLEYNFLGLKIMHLAMRSENKASQSIDELCLRLCPRLIPFISDSVLIELFDQNEGDDLFTQGLAKEIFARFGKIFSPPETPWDNLDSIFLRVSAFVDASDAFEVALEMKRNGWNISAHVIEKIAARFLPGDLLLDELNDLSEQDTMIVEGEELATDYNMAFFPEDVKNWLESPLSQNLSDFSLRQLKVIDSPSEETPLCRVVPQLLMLLRMLERTGEWTEEESQNFLYLMNDCVRTIRVTNEPLLIEDQIILLLIDYFKKRKHVALSVEYQELLWKILQGFLVYTNDDRKEFSLEVYREFLQFITPFAVSRLSEPDRVNFCKLLMDCQIFPEALKGADSASVLYLFNALLDKGSTLKNRNSVRSLLPFMQGGDQSVAKRRLLEGYPLDKAPSGEELSLLADLMQGEAIVQSVSDHIIQRALTYPGDVILDLLNRIPDKGPIEEKWVRAFLANAFDVNSKGFALSFDFVLSRCTGEDLPLWKDGLKKIVQQLSRNNLLDAYMSKLEEPIRRCLVLWPEEWKNLQSIRNRMRDIFQGLFKSLPSPENVVQVTSFVATLAELDPRKERPKYAAFVKAITPMYLKGASEEQLYTWYLRLGEFKVFPNALNGAEVADIIRFAEAICKREQNKEKARATLEKLLPFVKKNSDLVAKIKNMIACSVSKSEVANIRNRLSGDEISYLLRWNELFALNQLTFDEWKGGCLLLKRSCEGIEAVFQTLEADKRQEVLDFLPLWSKHLLEADIGLPNADHAVVSRLIYFWNRCENYPANKVEGVIKFICKSGDGKQIGGLFQRLVLQEGNDINGIEKFSKEWFQILSIVLGSEAFTDADALVGRIQDAKWVDRLFEAEASKSRAICLEKICIKAVQLAKKDSRDAVWNFFVRAHTAVEASYRMQDDCLGKVIDAYLPLDEDIDHVKLNLLSTLVSQVCSRNSVTEEWAERLMLLINCVIKNKKNTQLLPPLKNSLKNCMKKWPRTCEASKVLLNLSDSHFAQVRIFIRDLLIEISSTLSSKEFGVDNALATRCLKAIISNGEWDEILSISTWSLKEDEDEVKRQIFSDLIRVLVGQVLEENLSKDLNRTFNRIDKVKFIYEKGLERHSGISKVWENPLSRVIKSYNHLILEILLDTNERIRKRGKALLQDQLPSMKAQLTNNMRFFPIWERWLNDLSDNCNDEPAAAMETCILLLNSIEHNLPHLSQDNRHVVLRTIHNILFKIPPADAAHVKAFYNFASRYLNHLNDLRISEDSYRYLFKSLVLLNGQLEGLNRANELRYLKEVIHYLIPYAVAREGSSQQAVNDATVCLDRLLHVFKNHIATIAEARTDKADEFFGPLMRVMKELPFPGWCSHANNKTIVATIIDFSVTSANDLSEAGQDYILDRAIEFISLFAKKIKNYNDTPQGNLVDEASWAVESGIRTILLTNQLNMKEQSILFEAVENLGTGLNALKRWPQDPSGNTLQECLYKTLTAECEVITPSQQTRLSEIKKLANIARWMVKPVELYEASDEEEKTEPFEEEVHPIKGDSEATDDDSETNFDEEIEADNIAFEPETDSNNCTKEAIENT